ncbi:MAG: bifunctional fucokinase/L-fucose-1-P-guanylyltransferase [Lachnospiraceae bacterium]|nr:bifunctional fucokinase/L-fucose-1-P-guanylyltransferase [Lachnospiraceae bacterium]
MNTGLYLAQSYSDAWDDYQRSLKNQAFPIWDYIILTASNEHQAESFRLQLESRKPYLPVKTRIGIIPDEGGVRVGSGGATLSVLKWLKENTESGSDAWAGKRILVIHSGGDSKRVPQYSALGKLFSPVPHQLPDGRSSTLFDEFIIAMSEIPGRIREGMLLLSGDVLLLFNPLLIDWSGRGAAVISFKEDVETGKNHGVFLRSPSGLVQRFLHKQDVATLCSIGAVNEQNCVDIDTGAVLFGIDVLDALYSLISTDGSPDDQKYRAFVNDRVRLSLYGDFQYPLAVDSTLEQFYREKAEGEDNEELREARTAVWNALHGFNMKLLRIAPAKFIHFGTTGEILHLMQGGVDEYRELGWSGRINCSMGSASGYNSVISPHSSVDDDTYLEVSYVHGRSHIGTGSVLSYIEIYNKIIPDHVVLHGLKQTNGTYVVRIYGTGDNPKENKLFGRKIPTEFGSTLWTAQLYPEKKTIDEAVEAALRLYDCVMSDKWDCIERGKSLSSGFNDADPEAVIAWNDHMAELVFMNRIQELIISQSPASEVEPIPALTGVQEKWLENHLTGADYGMKMRLHFYVGTALNDESEISKAFGILSDAILESTLSGLKENTETRIMMDEHSVHLPLRVNFGGGWSDTPPYCNENGGTVLNAAITLNGERPVSVRLRKIPDHKIVFESRDMDVHGEFDRIEPLQSVGDPYDPYVLQKAALLACGVIPSAGGNLEAILTRLGGGIWMDTEVVGVPKGSGLGTSSILAAACVKAVFEFLGVMHTEDDLYSHVLCMEQIMSTGGGWQDQVGGVTDGIKFITSKPGLSQEIRVSHVILGKEKMKELNDRFALVYTGQRRLARNLLRDVVGRYIGNMPDTVYALNEIQRNAALQRFELERGNIDAFAELMTEHWKLSRMIDEGSSNTLIDQIFDSVDDLLAGKMICGAGGGGFLQMMLKKGVTREQLQARLKDVFSDTDIGVWECELV